MANVPVEFSVGGMREVQEALRTVGSAIEDIEKKSEKAAKNTEAAQKREEAAIKKRAATEKREAEKSQREMLKMQQASSNEHFKQWKSQQRAKETKQKQDQRQHDRAIATEKKRQENITKKFKEESGGVGAGVAIGGALIAIAALKTGLDMAGAALSQFASFVMSDVIKPELKIQKGAIELGNRLGASSGSVSGMIKGLDSQYSGFDKETIAQVLAAAGDQTGDLGTGASVASIALKQTQTYGGNAVELATHLGARRAKFSDMNDADFEAFANLQSGKARGKIAPNELAGLHGMLSGYADKFGGSHNVRAATEIGLTGVIAAASKSMNGTGPAAEGMKALFMDLAKSGQGLQGNGDMKSLSNSIPTLMKLHGGNMFNMQKNGVLSEGSANLLGALGVGEIYRNAEAKKASLTGKEAEKAITGEGAVKVFLDSLMDAGDAVKERTLTEEGFARSKQAGENQLNEAIKAVKAALAEQLMPVVLNDVIPALKDAGPKIADFVTKLIDAIKSMKDVDIVGMFKTIAEAIGQVFYHLLNLASATGVIKMDPKKLETLRQAVGAETTTTAAGNVTSSAGDGYFGGLWNTAKKIKNGDGSLADWGKLGYGLIQAPVAAPLALAASVGGRAVSAIGNASEDVKSINGGGAPTHDAIERNTKALEKNTQATRENTPDGQLFSSAGGMSGKPIGSPPNASLMP